MTIKMSRTGATMKRMKKIAILALGALAFFGSPEARAEAPSMMTYQGRLQLSGALANGPQTVKIKLCDMFDCSATVIDTGAQGVSVVNGLFKTTFTAPSGGIDFSTPGKNWYLQVEVNGTPLSPTERLTSSAFAVVAATAQFVSAGNIGAGVIGSGVIINAGSIGSGVMGSNVIINAGSIGSGTIGSNVIISPGSIGTGVLGTNVSVNAGSIGTGIFPGTLVIAPGLIGSGIIGSNVIVSAGSIGSGVIGSNVIINAGSIGTGTLGTFVSLPAHLTIDAAAGGAPTSSGCGTPTIVGKDSAGQVTVGGGSFASCSFTFASAFPTDAFCFVNLEFSASATGARVTASSNTGFTVTAYGGSFAGGDVFQYVCLGR